MENTLAAKPTARPENVEHILSSLDRYNPENIQVLQDYVHEQVASNTTDIAANLALLKLYQFNATSAKEDVIVIILTKALTRFYSSDFTTAMHLLPAYVTVPGKQQVDEDGVPISSGDDDDVPQLKEQVDKLFHLYSLLDGCNFTEFWAKFESDDSYADLVADVQNFEDDLRLSIAKCINVSCKKMDVATVKEWVNISSDAKFKTWVESLQGWKLDGSSVVIPLNKDNDAKPVVTAENVKFEQLNRLIKHAYELTV